MKWKKWHRIVGLIAALPLITVALTGILLILRNQLEWIQPQAVSATYTPSQPLLTLEQIKSIAGNEKIEQIIYRPSKNTLALRLQNGTELHLHPQTGEVLKAAKRRTNFLIEIHQGSYLGPIGQYGIYLSAGLSFVFLIISGLIIYPFRKRRI